MRPVVVRRLMVFGVCLAGACVLHVTPGLAGSVSAAPSDALLRPITAQTEGGVRDHGAALGSDQVADVGYGAALTVGQPAVDPTSPPLSTPFVPGAPADLAAPAPVAATVAAVTGDTVELAWPAGTDDVGVVAYRVEINGFERVVTDQLRVLVTWAPSDGDVNLVRVSAEDAAGNRSPVPTPLLVTRPAPTAPVPVSPAPTAAPTTPAPTPVPTSSPRPPGPAPSESAAEVTALPG